MCAKNNILLAIILPLAFLVLSCNQLQEVGAEKKGLVVSSSNTITTKKDTGSIELTTRPDLLSAFFWPSPRDLEKNQYNGVISNRYDYRTYIRDLSRELFIASNKFTALTLEYLQKEQEFTEEETKIIEQQAPIKNQIKVLSRKSKELTNSIRTLKNSIKSESNEQEKAKLTTKLTELERENKEIFSERKKLKQQLNPFKEKLAVLGDELLEINAQQLDKSQIIQQLLDPQAFSYVTDENGNILNNEYDLPMRTLDESKQVNYLKVYQASSSENSFDLTTERVQIQLGWWNNGQSYETLYTQDQNGNWNLSPESTIYDLTFSPSTGYLSFKFRERDDRGKETGQVFNFLLQKSSSQEYSLLVGDMILMTNEGVVLRRGQFKAIFL